MMVAIGVAVAGALGAPARFLLDGWVQDRAGGVFPWGTFVVNVSGSFLLGVITGLGLWHHIGATPRAVVGSGFCGAYTTFSTFSYETVRLAEDGSLQEAALNVVGSLAVGLVAAAVGLASVAAV